MSSGLWNIQLLYTPPSIIYVSQACGKFHFLYLIRRSIWHVYVLWHFCLICNTFLWYIRYYQYSFKKTTVTGNLCVVDIKKVCSYYFALLLCFLSALIIVQISYCTSITENTTVVHYLNNIIQIVLLELSQNSRNSS